MIFPLSSCSANNVPLNNFDKSSDIDISFIFRFLKKGSTDISLAIDKIGPGIPVPPLKPTVLLDPAISLIRWKNQTNVPLIIFEELFSPINILLL